jgi:osmoprotectant transport system ATP-binding protein
MGTKRTTVRPTGYAATFGYVLQRVELFPHCTIEHNIATVPSLLGWTGTAPMPGPTCCSS